MANYFINGFTDELHLSNCCVIVSGFTDTMILDEKCRVNNSGRIGTLKTVVGNKTRVEEKIVYKDRIKWKEKIVYKDKPAQEYNDLRDKVSILMEVNKESAKRIRQLERIIEKHTREGTWDIEPTKAEIKKIEKNFHIFIDD